jgi:hypothetical protein
MITRGLQISCDESGHTGPDLLRADQRFFAFGSVAIPDDEAKQIIQKIVHDNPVQMPELKAANSSALYRGKPLFQKL